MNDKPARVLLVDDEEELLNHLEKRLRARGLSVAAAPSGALAIDIAEQQTFDVAVVDLKMPGMDGIETLLDLKRLQPLLQVVMLTGHGSFEAAHESGKAHAYTFLTKPYEFDKLLVVINEACEAKRELARNSYQEELSEMVGSSYSPREIMSETERLRKKYEQ